VVKSIVSIGFSVADENVTHKKFSSMASLFDWDVILFRPDISQYIGRFGEVMYQGKRCLDDNSSFALKEVCGHWRREIKEAIDGGKTVIVFLSELEEVCVATGKKTFSGTGKNRQETRHVEVYSNYMSIPISEQITSTNGRNMRVAAPYSNLLTSFWSEFESDSSYHVIFENAKHACIQTKSGEKTVGLVVSSAKSSGHLLLLPDIDFDRPEFFTQSGNFSAKAVQFAGRFTPQIISLDRSLRSTTETTPEPPWLSDTRFQTKKEANLIHTLLLAEAAVEQAHRHKEAVEEQLQNAGSIKRLLFETGKVLEGSVIEALTVLGFSAAPFQDAKSEFDVVFESLEGRLIGEVEGKDTKAINIEKLRQLSMNVHEDLQRPEVVSAAKGILFGNGFRLSSPESRTEQFTDKCITASQSTGIGLVATSDLYVAAKYLSDVQDASYARMCREALISMTGIVVFPSLPKSADEVVGFAMESHDVYVEQASAAIGKGDAE
jgi:hypothetical protein